MQPVVLACSLHDCAACCLLYVNSLTGALAACAPAVLFSVVGVMQPRYFVLPLLCYACMQPVAFVASVGLCCFLLLSVANIIKSGKPTKNNFRDFIKFIAKNFDN